MGARASTGIALVDRGVLAAMQGDDEKPLRETGAPSAGPWALVRGGVERVARDRRALFAVSIVLATGATAAAIALRVARTHRVTFAFLSWNVFLAWVPWGLAVAATRLHTKRAPRALLYPVLAAWLAFFPNAPYLLTDFVHLRGGTNTLWWYDLLLLSAATASGWLCALDGLDRVTSIVRARMGRGLASAAVLACCWLAGLGVYLGRFLRFNTWEVLSNPRPLFTTLLDRLTHPLAHPRTHGFAIAFGALLVATYLPLALETLRRERDGQGTKSPQRA